MKFNSIEEAIKDIRLGKMIVVVDDEDREMKEICLWRLKKLRRKA